MRSAPSRGVRPIRSRCAGFSAWCCRRRRQITIEWRSGSVGEVPATVTYEHTHELIVDVRRRNQVRLSVAVDIPDRDKPCVTRFQRRAGEA
jgi:hypothetical protein